MNIGFLIFLENDFLTNITRFVNASVQTPNKLLRMVAEEICGQSARKPHAERDFKVILSRVEKSNTLMVIKHLKKRPTERDFKLMITVGTRMSNNFDG